MTTAELGARLDRLPFSRYHRTVALFLAFGFFFESGDLQLFGYLAPGLEKYMSFTVHDIAVVTASSFAGMFVGGMIGGWLSDRFGRRKIFLYAVAWYSAWSLLNAFAWNVDTIAVGRIMTGIGLSAMAVAGITYLSEVMPRLYRGRVQAAVLALGLAAIPIITFVARAVVPLGPDGWRYMFIIGAIGIVTLIVARRVPESPRWLLLHRGDEAAEATMTRIESAVTAELGGLPETTLNITAPAPAERPRPSALFHRSIAARTFLLLGAWIFQTLGLYGFQSWVPTLLVSHGFSISTSLTYAAITAIGAVPGALCAWTVSDRFRRKTPIVVMAILSAALGLAYGLSFNSVLIVVFGFALTFVMQMFVALLYSYTPELYPTELRNFGSGFVYGVGRLANVAGPFIIAAIFQGVGYVWVFVYITACWVIVALTVAIWGPRSGKKSLEELEEQALGSANPAGVSPFAARQSDIAE